MTFPYITEDTAKSPSDEMLTMEADEVQGKDVSYNTEDDISLMPGTDDYVESDGNLLVGNTS